MNMGTKRILINPRAADFLYDFIPIILACANMPAYYASSVDVWCMTFILCYHTILFLNAHYIQQAVWAKGDRLLINFLII